MWLSCDEIGLTKFDFVDRNDNDLDFSRGTCLKFLMVKKPFIATCQLTSNPIYRVVQATVERGLNGCFDIMTRITYKSPMNNQVKINSFVFNN